MHCIHVFIENVIWKPSYNPSLLERMLVSLFPPMIRNKVAYSLDGFVLDVQRVNCFVDARIPPLAFPFVRGLGLGYS